LVYLAPGWVKVLLLILSNKSIQYFCSYDLTGLKKLPYLKMVLQMAMGKRIKMGTIPGLVGNFTKKDGIKSL